MAAALLDVTAQIGECSAKADVIVDQKVIGSRDYLAGESGGGRKPTPTIRARMRDLVRLHNGAGRKQGKTRPFADLARHRVRHRVETGDLNSGDGNHEGATLAQQCAQTVDSGFSQQVVRERQRSVGVSGFGVRQIWMSIAGRQFAMNDDFWKCVRPWCAGSVHPSSLGAELCPINNIYSVGDTSDVTTTADWPAVHPRKPARLLSTL